MGNNFHMCGQIFFKFSWQTDLEVLNTFAINKNFNTVSVIFELFEKVIFGSAGRFGILI